MRRWPERFAATIFEDPTRQIQVLGVIAALLVAHWLWTYQVPADPKTADAVFYFFSARTFAWMLVAAASLQLLAVAGPWWRLRLAAALIKMTIWVYAAGCFTFVNREALALPFLIAFSFAELGTAMRALHDKELNGTERRMV